jgi:hypothetical protein
LSSSTTNREAACSGALLGRTFVHPPLGKLLTQPGQPGFHCAACDVAARPPEPRLSESPEWHVAGTPGRALGMRGRGTGRPVR